MEFFTSISLSNTFLLALTPDSKLVWLHMIFDSLTGLSCFIISCFAIYYQRKQNVPFPYVYRLFAIFLLSCCITHYVGIWTLYNTKYQITLLKALTSTISVLIVVVLIRVFPKLLELPGSLVLNEQLKKEIAIRSEVETELRKSQAQLQSIFNSIPDSIVMANLNREIVLVNPAFHKLFGYTTEDVYLKKTQVLYCSENEFLEQGRKRFNTSSHFDSSPYEIRYKKKDGSTFISDCVGTQVKNEEGEAFGFLGIIRDITEKKSLEQDFITQKQILQLVLESMEEGVIFTDPKGNIIFFNKAAEKLTGGIKTTHRGYWSQDYGMFYPDEKTRLPEEELPIKLAIEGKKSGTIELFIKNPDLPQGIHVIGTASPVKKDDKLEGGVVVFRDITSRKKLETEWKKAKDNAEESNRLKSIFLANMSHEIRTPMNGIISMASLLMESNLTKKQTEFASIIRNCGESLLTIINDILDFSKIEAGKIQLEEQNFNLTQCIEDVLDLLAQQAKDKNNELSYNISSLVPNELYGDITRLRQILVNLVGNAIKFTGEGKIRIDVKSNQVTDDDVELEFSVQDAGCGVPEDQIADIFNPFHQVTSLKGGTGLGLSICKRLTSTMSGDIWCKNNHDHGCTFTFTVHLKKACEEYSSSQEISTLSLAAKELQEEQGVDESLPLRILVAEDNVVNQAIAQHALKHLGYLPDIVGNGLEAIKAIKNKQYDIVFMDVRMPEMNGIEASQYIIQHFKVSQRPKIVAVTANAMQGDREKCLEAGMDDYISKPIAIEDIVRILKKWGNQSSRIKSLKRTSSFLDTRSINELKAYGDSFHEEIISLFLENTANALKNIENAITEENLDQIIFTAHQLTGASKSVGAKKIAQAAQEIESSAKKPDLNKVRTLYETLQDAYDITKPLLEETMNESK